MSQKKKQTISTADNNGSRRDDCGINFNEIIINNNNNSINKNGDITYSNNQQTKNITSQSNNAGQQQQQRKQHFNNDNKQMTHNPTTTTPKLKKKLRSPPSQPTIIYTTGFPSMHEKCRAARYKVHYPLCLCPKMKSLRDRLLLCQPSHDDNDDESDNNVDNDISLDGLIVAPQTKNISAIYHCLDTSPDIYHDDPLGTEMKLSREIFDFDYDYSHDNNNDGTPPPPFKISCAGCLLRESQIPNGFICALSPCVSTLHRARRWAQKRKCEKLMNGIGLHHDHAHEVAVIDVTLLWHVKKCCNDFSKKKKEKKKDDNDGSSDERCFNGGWRRILTNEMVTQGVISSSNNQDSDFMVTYKLGHHLAVLLGITRHDWSFQCYWFVIVYNDTPPSSSSSEIILTIDLPGGKRHLGETSLMGGVRETEEESSLIVDDRWMVVETREAKAAEENLYFLVMPQVNVGVKRTEAGLVKEMSELRIR